MHARNIESRLTPLDDEYETCERTHAVLRIHTGSMSPAVVTELLHIEPTTTTVIGHSGSTGEHIGRVNLWSLSSELTVKSRDLRRHLDWLTARINERKAELRRLQSIEYVKMDVSCIWWSSHGDGGPVLWPEQMLALSQLNLELSIACSFYE